MQAKGLVRFFAIALALVCIYQLSFTFKAYRVERDAMAAAQSLDCTGLAPDSCAHLQKTFYTKHLDSLLTENVYNLLVKKFTWEQVQDNRLNLGLDLQGGMSVILQVSVEEMLQSLAGPNAEDPDFVAALNIARSREAKGEHDFMGLFLDAYLTSNPGEGSLGYIFGTTENEDLFPPDITNAEASKVLRTEASGAISRTHQILVSRIDKFGVASPSIQRLATSDRILIELPGVDNPTRVRRILQATAKLEFWETWRGGEISDELVEADKALADMMKLGSVDTGDAEADTASVAIEPTAEADTSTGDEVTISDDTGSLDFDFGTFEDFTGAEDTTLEPAAQQTPLLTLLQHQAQAQSIYGPIIGVVHTRDTARVKRIFAMPEIREQFRDDLQFLWGHKPNENGHWEIYAIKLDEATGKAPLTGEVVTDAFQGFDQLTNRPNVQMKMNNSGSNIWEKLTTKLAPPPGSPQGSGGYVAVVLDDEVYSCPVVMGPIPGGQTEISGNFTIKEAQDLANVLKTGKLPAPAKIVQESQVGPTLGKASVQAGVKSLTAGLILVLIFMVFYYAKSGLVADLALILNVFFIFGILAALSATLTLPGIAGIVLTIGMAVDANVIIFERIREEVLKGKGVRLALIDGYKNSYSSIIDANVTTLITAFILYYFGMGPVKGFATVLMIGILSSLFTAVLVSRMAFDWMINREMKLSYGNKLTIKTLSNANFDFLKRKKLGYAISAIVLVAGMASFFTKGFHLGVDFKGGRAYDIAFDKPVSMVDVRKALTAEFGTPAPIVKEVSLANKAKITTSFLIDSAGRDVDSIVHTKLMGALLPFYDNGPSITYEQFITPKYTEAYTKVEATIADDIKRSSVWAGIFAIVAIFVYILIRFRKWQFSVGTIAALMHDVLVVLAVFSIFSGILPFSMEVDQAFIAAILTVIGYSVNDTVIVFDRIREHMNDPRKEPLADKVNSALNKTLSRTLITSGTTLLTIVILFIFGGDVIRGFAFAITLGILVGTYSSWFIAAPLMYDLMNRTEAARERRKSRVRPQQQVRV